MQYFYIIIASAYKKLSLQFSAETFKPYTVTAEK